MNSFGNREVVVGRILCRPGRESVWFSDNQLETTLLRMHIICDKTTAQLWSTLVKCCLPRWCNTDKKSTASRHRKQNIIIFSKSHNNPIIALQVSDTRSLRNQNWISFMVGLNMMARIAEKRVQRLQRSSGNALVCYCSDHSDCDRSDRKFPNGLSSSGHGILVFAAIARLFFRDLSECNTIEAIIWKPNIRRQLQQFIYYKNNRN